LEQQKDVYHKYRMPADKKSAATQRQPYQQQNETWFLCDSTKQNEQLAAAFNDWNERSITLATSSSSGRCLTKGFVSTGLLISASFSFSSFRRATAASSSGSSFGCQSHPKGSTHKSNPHFEGNPLDPQNLKM
jgi:hypothetical protein